MVPRRRKHKTDQAVRSEEALTAFLRKRGLTQEARHYRLLMSFAEACGPWLAAHVRAERVVKGVLYVRVEDASWNQHVSMIKHNILKTLQESESGKALTDIRFKVGPLQDLPAWDKQGD